MLCSALGEGRIEQRKQQQFFAQFVIPYYLPSFLRIVIIDDCVVSEI
jgi:hypothetical protein